MTNSTNTCQEPSDDEGWYVTSCTPHVIGLLGYLFCFFRRSSSASEVDPDLSEYAQQRLERIQENKAMWNQLCDLYPSPVCVTYMYVLWYDVHMFTTLSGP